MIYKLLWVGLGGGLGAMARYLVGLGAVRLAGPGFPYGTLAVNVMGCAAIGLFMAAAGPQGLKHDGIRLFLVAGLFGGFTTFSAFGIESFQFLARGEMRAALINIFANLVLGLLAVWGGFLIMSWLRVKA